MPALLKGLEFAHIFYGNLPWHDIVEPSAKLAREGFVVSKDLVDEVSRNTDYGTYYNGPLNPGDILQLHELANTLDMVAEYGVKGTLCIILSLQLNLQLQIIIFMQCYFDFFNRTVLKLLNFFLVFYNGNLSNKILHSSSNLHEDSLQELASYMPTLTIAQSSTLHHHTIYYPPRMSLMQTVIETLESLPILMGNASTIDSLTLVAETLMHIHSSSHAQHGESYRSNYYWQAF